MQRLFKHLEHFGTASNKALDTQYFVFFIFLYVSGTSIGFKAGWALFGLIKLGLCVYDEYTNDEDYKRNRAIKKAKAYLKKYGQL